MPPTLWMSRSRFKRRPITFTLRHAPLCRAGIAAVALLSPLLLTTLSLAREPLAPIPQATPTRMTLLSLATLPCLAAAIVLAMGFLILFNQKLQREVRDRERAEKKLRDAEREKAIVLNSIAERVIYLDPEQRLLWANQAVRSQSAAPPGAYIGKRCFDIWGENTGPCEGCPVERTLADGSSQEAEIEFASGRTWRIQAYPVTGEEGRTDGVVVISRDITEDRRRQEEILNARKLKSVGVLAGGIAHDFNNMLTAVMGYISLAELKQGGDTETEAYLKKAMAASSRAKQLAARLLTFSQGGHPVRRRVGVETLLAKAAETAVSEHPITLRMEVAPECTRLWCDKTQVQQAVGNVILNACESMPAGGEVLLRATCKKIREGFGTVLLPGGYLRISVCDRGAGIPAEIVDKIFDPYFTTKPMGAEKGSGLGLAITHSILQKHQGYVSVEERSGGGTAVHLYFPLDAEDPLAKCEVASRAAPAPGHGGGRILVLEDEPLVWEVAEMLLTHLGYTVTRATHGEAAVDLYKVAQAAGEPFGTVILDLTIKGGMGGRETLEALKRLDPEVRAFVSSGYSSDPVLTDYRRYGFSGVIPKPYSLEEVKRALASAPEPPDRILSGTHD